MQQLKHIENNYSRYFLDLLLFFILAILENIHMIRVFSNLFFEDDNTIN